MVNFFFLHKKKIPTVPDLELGSSSPPSHTYISKRRMKRDDGHRVRMKMTLDQNVYQDQGKSIEPKVEPRVLHAVPMIGA